MLIATNISISYGPSIVLSDVSLTVGPGHRVAVLGRNGVGKSTLLRILAGVEAPDRGIVERVPASLAVGYLAQETEPLPGESVLDHVARRTGMAAVAAEMERLAARMEVAPDAVEPYLEALERFRSLGGDDLEARVTVACREAGLPDSAVHAPVRTLSGGQRMRASLASLMLSRADVLLLDEPTNDLDLDGLARLESFLAGFSGGVVVVSHDRTFLHRSVDRLIEIDQFTRTIATYEGGWSGYVEERARRRRRVLEASIRSDRERRRLLDAAGSIRSGSSAGAARARRRHVDNDKNVRAAKVSGAERHARRAKAPERRAARVAVVEKPREPWQLHLSLSAERRSGDLVVRLDQAVVERGRFVLGPLDVELRWRDRVALLGPNGSGKSTLLAALTGRLPLHRGRRRAGRNAVFGELEQDRRPADPDMRLIDAFCHDTGLPPGDARTLLAKFDLGADDVLRPTAELSPGERTRVALAALMARGTNCLVLDEPTNHLDLAAVEMLESALAGFDGTLIIATHDRSLMNAIAITRTIDVGALPRGPGDPASAAAAGTLGRP
jgi:ATPase subunit of ABC transporter with duplicated ATPase domains